MEERPILLPSDPPSSAVPVWLLLVLAGLFTAGGVVGGAIWLTRAADISGRVRLLDCARAGLIAIAGASFGGAFFLSAIAVRRQVPKKVPRDEFQTGPAHAEAPFDEEKAVSEKQLAVNEMPGLNRRPTLSETAPLSADPFFAGDSPLQSAPKAACPIGVSQQQRLLETLLDDAVSTEKASSETAL